MVIEVKLTKGKTAIIEDTDADIAELKCHADRYGDRYYAVVPGHKKMRRVIMAVSYTHLTLPTTPYV